MNTKAPVDFREVTRYLEKLNLRTKFMGYDKEEVLKAMDELDSLYREEVRKIQESSKDESMYSDIIKSMDDRNKEQVEDLTEQIAKLEDKVKEQETLLSDKERKIENAKAIAEKFNQYKDENEKLKRGLEEAMIGKRNAETELGLLKEKRDENSEQAELFAKAMVDVQKDKAVILENAKREAEETLSSARAEAEDTLSAAKREAEETLEDARREAREVRAKAEVDAEAKMAETYRKISAEEIEHKRVLGVMMEMKQKAANLLHKINDDMGVVSEGFSRLEERINDLPDVAEETTKKKVITGFKRSESDTAGFENYGAQR